MLSHVRSVKGILVAVLGLAMMTGPALASPAQAALATPLPTPVVDPGAAACPSSPAACLNDANANHPGMGFAVKVGDIVEVALLGFTVTTGQSGTWSASAGAPSVLSKISETPANATIYRADFKAVGVGSTTVTAIGQMTCTPPCPGPIKQLTWQVQVGPAASPSPVPTPSCAPTADVCLTSQNAAIGGNPLSASFIVKVGAVIQVALSGQPANAGGGMQWQTSTYDPTVVSKQGETGSSGFYLATFNAIATGTSTISAEGGVVCRPIPCPGPVILMRWVIGVGGPPTPEAPTNLMVLPDGGGAVSLSFDPPGAGADFYAIYGYSLPSGHTLLKVVPANATPTLTGLTPGEFFTFTAIGYNRTAGAGNGPTGLPGPR